MRSSPHACGERIPSASVGDDPAQETARATRVTEGRQAPSLSHDLSSLFPEDNGTLTREQYLAIRNQTPVHVVEVKP